jgi:hypothetical protein
MFSWGVRLERDLSGWARILLGFGVGEGDEGGGGVGDDE